MQKFQGNGQGFFHAKNWAAVRAFCVQEVMPEIPGKAPQLLDGGPGARDRIPGDRSAQFRKKQAKGWETTLCQHSSSWPAANRERKYHRILSLPLHRLLPSFFLFFPLAAQKTTAFLCCSFIDINNFKHTNRPITKIAHGLLYAWNCCLQMSWVLFHQPIAGILKFEI